MKTEEVLNLNLTWIKEGDSRFFYTPAFPKELCCLRMNNFPDESLWTLLWNSDQVDLEGTPDNWTIQYSS